MLHLKRATIKLEKYLQLKCNFIAAKRLLTQHVLSCSSLQSSHDHYFEGTLTSDHVRSLRPVNVKRCAVVNSKRPFSATIPHESNLISIKNITPLQRSLKNVAVLSNSFDHISLRIKKSNNIRSTLTTRQYCTCPPKLPGRHLYHEETENAINQQILSELNACYAYLSMACYFGRTEVALPGCHGLFMKMHEEEREHAQMFINYQNMRGGHVKLCQIQIPDCQDWESAQKALAVAVEMEKLVKEKLICLHKIAEKHYDLSVMDLVADFIQEQERSIQELSRLLIRATKMGSSEIAEYLFDKEVHRAFVKDFPLKLDVKPLTENKETKTNVYA